MFQTVPLRLIRDTCLLGSPTVDYNAWIESDKGRRLRASLDPNVVLAEGYKEYNTGRTYLAGMGDWRKDKDEEIELDGIGGVNIVVKADVHRSGMCSSLTILLRLGKWV